MAIISAGRRQPVETGPGPFAEKHRLLNLVWLLLSRASPEPQYNRLAPLPLVQDQLYNQLI